MIYTEIDVDITILEQIEYGLHWECMLALSKSHILCLLQDGCKPICIRGDPLGGLCDCLYNEGPTILG